MTELGTGDAGGGGSFVAVISPGKPIIVDCSSTAATPPRTRKAQTAPHCPVISTSWKGFVLLLSGKFLPTTVRLLPTAINIWYPTKFNFFCSVVHQIVISRLTLSFCGSRLRAEFFQPLDFPLKPPCLHILYPQLRQNEERNHGGTADGSPKDHHVN
jgi:hypothetical protein